MSCSDKIGIVSQIQSFCVNDGEGIRTNIFLSGCPLTCKWCSNPETWTLEPKLTVVKEKCNDCNNCVKVCQRKAALNPFNNDVFVTEECNACGVCVDSCPNSARKVLGSRMSVQDVAKRIKRDTVFFRESGGGVTFSGGEPTFQKDFLRALVNEFYEIGIDMAIETCGYFSWEDTKDIIEKLDFIFVDIKHFDKEEHIKLTGVDNNIILENIKNMGKLNKNMVIRIPLIEGINTDIENIIKTAAFVKKHIPRGKIEILPYHSLGTYKYDALSISGYKNIFETPSNEKISEIKDIILQNGVETIDYK